MPLVRIEVLKGRPAAEKKQLLDAVHAALVEAFGIPEDDRTQRLIEHDRENFEIESARSERYTLVEITAFPGRSREAKRMLYTALVRNLEAIGTPANDVLVVIQEPPLHDWAIQGGRPADEVELGYNLDT
jgi:phenylpyruvate tautomerase PptA (4-oxalocrotonate tautomerase family)